MDQDLVDAVALALAGAEAVPFLSPQQLREHSWQEYLQRQARVAVTTVHASEKCAGCGCELAPPALCPECAAKSE